MKLGDRLRFVHQNMKRNKSRIFMTVLAAAIGCAFLVVLSSVAFGFHKTVVQGLLAESRLTEIKINDVLQDQDLQKFKKMPHIKSVNFKNFVSLPLAPEVENKKVNIDQAISQNIDLLKLSAGRHPKADDEVVIGWGIRIPEGNFNPTKVKGNLPEAKQWLGKTMNLQLMQRDINHTAAKKNIAVKIVGVTEKPHKDKLDANLYLGIDTVKKIESFTHSQWGEIREKDDVDPNSLISLQDPRQYLNVLVNVDSPENIKAVNGALTSQGYSTYSVQDTLNEFDLIFLIVKIGLIFIGLIAIIISSIGIFNTMTMAVTERTQEIGIMKAIGAHPKTVRKIFLLESGMIGFLGVLLGLFVAYLLSFVLNLSVPLILNSFLKEETLPVFQFSYIPPSLAIGTGVFCITVALFSGSRPARKATKVDVLRALRRDI